MTHRSFVHKETNAGRLGSRWAIKHACVKRSFGKRRGAAIVEFSVCLPVIALVVFASLEGANMLFVRQATVQAAYEAAKAGSRRDGTSTQSERIATEVLAARRIANPTVTFVTGDPASTGVGRDVTIRVSVNSNERLITGFRIFSGRRIEATATMQKE